MFSRLPPDLRRDVANYCYDEAKTTLRVEQGKNMMAWWFGWLKYRGVRCREFMEQGRELLATAMDDERPRGQIRWLHEVFGFTRANTSRGRLLNALEGSVLSDNADAVHPWYTDIDALNKYFGICLSPHVDIIARTYIGNSLFLVSGDSLDYGAMFFKRLMRAARRETRNYWMAHIVASR